MKFTWFSFLALVMTNSPYAAQAGTDCRLEQLRQYVHFSIHDGRMLNNPLSIYNSRRLVSINSYLNAEWLALKAEEKNFGLLSAEHFQTSMILSRIKKDERRLSYPKAQANEDPAIISAKIKDVYSGLHADLLKSNSPEAIRLLQELELRINRLDVLDYWLADISCSDTQH